MRTEIIVFGGSVTRSPSAGTSDLRSSVPDRSLSDLLPSSRRASSRRPSSRRVSSGFCDSGLACCRSPVRLPRSILSVKKFACRYDPPRFLQTKTLRPSRLMPPKSVRSSFPLTRIISERLGFASTYCLLDVFAPRIVCNDLWESLDRDRDGCLLAANGVPRDRHM